MSFNTVIAEDKKRPLATIAQTETWLVNHIEAWDDVLLPKITANKCVIKKDIKSKSELLNVKGVILPIEVISIDSNKHATIRVRVKENRSAKYAMSRKCDQSNDWCNSSKGKFQPEPYIDFTVRYTEPYTARDRSIAANKANRLESAINHYARLCGNTYKDDEENIRF